MTPLKTTNEEPPEPWVTKEQWAEMWAYVDEQNKEFKERIRGILKEAVDNAIQNSNLRRK